MAGAKERSMVYIIGPIGKALNDRILRRKAGLVGEKKEKKCGVYPNKKGAPADMRSNA